MQSQIPRPQSFTELSQLHPPWNRTTDTSGHPDTMKSNRPTIEPDPVETPEINPKQDRDSRVRVPDDLYQWRPRLSLQNRHGEAPARLNGEEHGDGQRNRPLRREELHQKHRVPSCLCTVSCDSCLGGGR